MWEGFVGQRIAATAKTLKHIGLVLMFAALALAVLGARTFLNFKAGPAHLDEAGLQSIKNLNLQFRDYVTVEGRKTVSSGITAIEKTMRNGVVESERTTGEFMLLAVGDHILVVKAKPDQKAQKFTGALVSLPDDVKKKIFSNLDDADLQAATYPIMLDATVEYGEALPAGYFGVAVLLLSGFFLITKAKRRSEMPEGHPICKALAQYGPLASIVPQIDAEFTANSIKFGSAYFTQSWIFACWVERSYVLRRDELLWAYKKRTKHSVNFIPTGSSYSLVLRDARGKLVEISGPERDVDSLIMYLAHHSPWVVIGFDKKTDKLYKKDRQGFAQVVAERRASGVAI